MKRNLILIGVSGVLIAFAVSGKAITWALIDTKIRREFPAIRRITPAELAAWLRDPGRTPPLLLDVRTRPEYEVSHLATAQHVEPSSPASAIDEPKDRPIVTYCSVGYRSGAFAERLRLAGFSSVANLEGSIFRWANEGYPVYRDGEKVKKVHPYNRFWGLLLRKKHRASARQE
ncbi:MAG: rhodanese-like domain-containing protein [Chthoniobacterales bacterium]